MASSQRVAVVTGSSSGNGYETSLTLARNGFLTYATMRNLNKGENTKSLTQKEKLPMKTVQLDVTDDISVKNAIQSITAESNRIDVLVNNAGYELVGAFEDSSMATILGRIRKLYSVNRFSICEKSAETASRMKSKLPLCFLI
jgi:NAD(P)-dependent dehydrogenase (short-subunit alcohol dehydrogenase family)